MGLQWEPVEPVQPVQMNIYKNNTCRKDLSWLHFNIDPNVQERKCKTNSSIVFFCSLWKNQEANGSTSPDITTVLHTRPYGTFIVIKCSFSRKKPCRTTKGSNCHNHSFSNKDNVRAPTQFRVDRKPKHLKRWLLFKNRSINFHIN